MKKNILSFLLSSFVFVCAYSQDIIKAEKEVLGTIPVYNRKIDYDTSTPMLIYYSYDEQIGYCGPSIGKDGTLYIFTIYDNGHDGEQGSNSAIKFKNGKFSESVIPDLGNAFSIYKKHYDSENGYIGGTLCLSEKKGGTYGVCPPLEEIIREDYKKIRRNYSYESYKFIPTSFGSLVYSDEDYCIIKDYSGKDTDEDNEKEKKPYWRAVVFDENTKDKPKIITGSELEEFLSKSPDSVNFRYENGTLYSNKNNLLMDYYMEDLYACTLESGHILISQDARKWKGSAYFEKKYAIVSTFGNIECFIEMPWCFDSEHYAPKKYHTSSSGNYGEIYCLLPPPTSKIYEHRHEYEPPREDDAIIEGNVELAVTRTHLKHFGVLTDDFVHLRREATRKSESLGKYNKGTGFYIIDVGKKVENIGGDVGVWYKVRLHDKTEGYFFGAYLKNLYDGPGKTEKLPWKNVRKF